MSEQTKRKPQAEDSEYSLSAVPSAKKTQGLWAAMVVLGRLHILYAEHDGGRKPRHRYEPDGLSFGRFTATRFWAFTAAF